MLTEVCQTSLYLFFIAVILKIPTRYQTSTCSSDFLIIIHTHNYFKRPRDTPHPSGLIDLCQMTAISRHMDTLLYLMESWLPRSDMFSIQICFKWTGKTRQSHFTHNAICRAPAEEQRGELQQLVSGLSFMPQHRSIPTLGKGAAANLCPQNPQVVSLIPSASRSVERWDL